MIYRLGLRFYIFFSTSSKGNIKMDRAIEMDINRWSFKQNIIWEDLSSLPGLPTDFHDAPEHLLKYLFPITHDV